MSDARSDGGGKKTGKPRREREAPVAPETEGEVLPAPDDRVLLFADSVQEQRRAEAEKQHQWETWVTCRVEGEIFALPVKQVQEILRVSALTRVPHAPFPVRGVTNLRGYVLPVVDLRVRLGIAPEEPGPRHRVMVVQSRGRLIGLLVDAVEQVTQIDRLAVERVPDDVMTAQSYYLLGVYHEGDEMVILLDADRVLLVRDRDQTAARG